MGARRKRAGHLPPAAHSKSAERYGGNAVRAGKQAGLCTRLLPRGRIPRKPEMPPPRRKPHAGGARAEARRAPADGLQVGKRRLRAGCRLPRRPVRPVRHLALRPSLRTGAAPAARAGARRTCLARPCGGGMRQKAGVLFQKAGTCCGARALSRSGALHRPRSLLPRQQFPLSPGLVRTAARRSCTSRRRHRRARKPRRRHGGARRTRKPRRTPSSGDHLLYADALQRRRPFPRREYRLAGRTRAGGVDGHGRRRGRKG